MSRQGRAEGKSKARRLPAGWCQGLGDGRQDACRTLAIFIVCCRVIAAEAGNRVTMSKFSPRQTVWVSYGCLRCTGCYRPGK